MLLGVHEQYTKGEFQTTPKATMLKFPNSALAREFSSKPIPPQNLIPKFNSACAEVLKHMPYVVFSFKPETASVTNGKWRPFIEQFISHLVTNKLHTRVIVCIWHEPENDMSAEEFVPLFDTVHDWIKGVNSRVLTTHASLGYRYRDNGEINDDESKRWVTKADIDSIDIYSGQSFPLDMILPASSAFKRWKASRPSGRPWGVSERGWITGTDHDARAASIKAEFTWLSELDPKSQPTFYCVWNTVGTENNPKILLDEKGIAAVNQGFELLLKPKTPVKTEPKVETKSCPLCSGSGKVAATKTYVIVTS